MRWTITYSKAALNDAKKLTAAGLNVRAQELIELLTVNPFKNPPKFEKLVGDLQGAYSRRINVQHRLVYDVDKSAGTVYILRMWSHYE